jgi:glucose-6-phosphate isomerase
MPADLIRYDPQGVFLPQHGMAVEDLAALAPPLESARDEVLEDARQWASGAAVSPDKRPIDAGFSELPERLLAEYRELGKTSQLGRIQATADRLAEISERVVVLGIGGSYMGARAIQEACCHPYYNELPRTGRNGRPRLSYAGNNVDNDDLHGLLDLLSTDSSTGIEDQWSLVVISKSGGTLETAAATRILLRHLQKACANDPRQLAQRVVPVTGNSGKLFDLASAIGTPELFQVPDGVGGRFSVLSPVGLLPAALLGLDIVQLLEGAVVMNEHFRTAEPGNNVVLDFTGVCHHMEVVQGCAIRVLSTWGSRLEGAGLWYDQLLAESLGKQQRGATPLTVVNTRDLHSRGQQHQEGKRDKLITNVIVDTPTHQPLAIGTSGWNQDQLNELADKTLPDILEAATEGTNQAYREENRPTANINLPLLNEHVLGQLLQMFMLATVVEGRLIKINPYGQPGVEAYKRNMNAILRGTGA